MILVLTYHKVLRETVAEARAEFYTIRAEQLERQLELLARSDYSPLSPQQLLEQKSFARRNYILSFDDGTEDHYDVVIPVLARYKLRAIFFVPTAKIDQPGYLKAETVKKMSQEGHTIGCHSHEHRRMDQLTKEDIRVQLESARKRLNEITGQPAVIFAPPGGYINSRVRQVALETGMQVIRTMKWGYNTHPDLTSLDCIPLNRHLTEMEFNRILEVRNLAAIYRAKQIAKKLIPIKLYEIIREFLFGLTRRK